MPDKTTVGISDELRQYIEDLVAEVVLEGKSFENHKKYLGRFCDAEGLDYLSLEANLTTLFETTEELKAHESKGSEHLVRVLGKECYLANDKLKQILSSINRQRKNQSKIEIACKPARQKDELKQESAKHNSRINTIPEFIAPVSLDNRWCLIDSEGYTVRFLPYPHRDGCEVGPFHEGFAKVRYKSRIGYIDKEGREIVPITYHIGSHYSGHRVAVKTGASWGYLDTSGKVVIPFIYESARDFSDGLAAVEKNEKWGYIDNMGNVVIPFIFENALSFSEGLAPVCFEGRYGYINSIGNVAIPDKIDKNRFNLFIRKQIRNISGKFTLLNINRESVTHLPYLYALPFSEGMAVVQVNEDKKTWQESSRYKFIDKHGDYLHFSYCDNSFGRIGSLSEGIVAVSKGKFVPFFDLLCKNEDLGYIDSTGKIIHGFHLHIAYPFKEGLARVGFTDGGIKHTGFIDKSGKLVLDYKRDEYDVFYNFSYGLTPIGKRHGYGWKYGYINKKGNVVIPFCYDCALEFGT